MTSGPFATCAARPGIGLGELALALAAEFGPADFTGVSYELEALSLRLRGAEDLEPLDQLEALGALMTAFRPVRDPLRRRPLMLDVVLRDRPGDPAVLAVVATDVARRAGLDVAIASDGDAHVVAHRRGTRPYVLALDAPGARLMVVRERAMGWCCPHRMVSHLIGELLEHARRVGDVSAAIHAAELRLALPLNGRARLAMRAELAAARAVLN